MKVCPSHWAKLRRAIDARGMTPLVARNGSEALERSVEELRGEAAEPSLDPLMAAHNMIVAAVIQRVGLQLFVGDQCPVCVGIKTNEGVIDPELERAYTAEEEESYWIDGPAGAVLDIVKRSPALCAMLGWECGL